MKGLVVELNANKTVLPNGGLMTVNLYRMASGLAQYWKSNPSPSDSSKVTPAMIMNWTEPKGEIIVI
jgi:hypothetical protein